MEQLSFQSSGVLSWLFESTIYISILICLIFIIKVVFKKKLPAWWSYCLWLLLLVRMLIPFGVETPVSVYNYVPAVSSNSSYMPYLVQHKINTTSIQYAPEVPTDFSFDAVPAQSGFSDGPINEQHDAHESASTVIDTLSGLNLSFEGALFLLWITGVLAFGIAAVYKNCKFWLIVRREQPVTDKDVFDLFNECRSTLGLQKNVEIIVTESVKSPAIFGYFRPQLLLPANFLNTLKKDDLYCVFLHELGHVKRHDIGVSWLATLFQVVYWFNPLVWYAFHYLRADQEAACDAYVLSKIKQSRPTDYARTIVHLLERFVQNRQLPSLAGIIENRSQIDRRISMILEYKRLSIKTTIASVFMLLIVACVFFACSNGLAANKPDGPAADKPDRSVQDNSAELLEGKPIKLAANKPAGDDFKKGLSLKYDFKNNKSLNYRRTSESTLFMLVPGQTAKFLMKDRADYVIKGNGTDEKGNLITRVTINDWDFSIDNPQVHLYPDTSRVEGKNFNVIYSPEGKEIENLEIDDLPDVSMGMISSAPLIPKRFFSDLLPELPDDNVKIGDTWTLEDVKRWSADQLKFNTKAESINTFDGFETVQGMECVRIKSQVVGGGFHGTGKLEGKDFRATSGDSDTTMTWYFAYKKGIFVKSIMESIGTMEVTHGPLEAPLMSKAKTTVELVQ